MTLLSHARNAVECIPLRKIERERRAGPKLRANIDTDAQRLCRLSRQIQAHAGRGMGVMLPRGREAAIEDARQVARVDASSAVFDLEHELLLPFIAADDDIRCLAILDGVR